MISFGSKNETPAQSSGSIPLEIAIPLLNSPLLMGFITLHKTLGHGDLTCTFDMRNVYTIEYLYQLLMHLNPLNSLIMVVLILLYIYSASTIHTE